MILEIVGCLGARLIVEKRGIGELAKRTPKRVRERARDVSTRLFTRTKAGKYVYETRSTGGDGPYRTTVEPYPGGKSLKRGAVVSCSCPFFRYVLEVSLNAAEAAFVQHSTGADPKVRNKGMRKYLCKHLYATYEDLKERGVA